MSDLELEEAVSGLDIAIVGMSGRFPGARNIDEFWQNLRGGVESISFFSEEEAIAEGVDPQELRNPHYVRAAGVLEEADMFDAAFFGLYPKEAALMDPQHRVFLECAWAALEHAGYDPERYKGLIGVFAGTGMNTYLLFNLLNNSVAREADYQLTIGNDKDFLPTRASYKLNLRGPSINVQTACSTSLVAAHLACQSLLSYQCDMALAGGVTIRVPQKRGYLYQDGGITSPDGHCRPFDAAAQGTVGSNGAGIVVLKRLSDALADRDTIYAVIKGSAINNDGSGKVGYTAPSVDGQADVIATAQAIAGVEPETISYIEAHGTGTPIGDPIEIAALTRAFRAGTDKQGFCAIGSLKSNVGHLDAAAGVAGLLKTTLALAHRELPPSLHYTSPNPALNLDRTPFYVNAQLTPWRSDGAPRRAGVSSFGIGGTNVHMVLEQAPAPEPSSDSRAWQLVLLSGKTPAALEAATANLTDHLRQHANARLADVAYTTQVGRQAFSHRRVAIARTTAEAGDMLLSLDQQRVRTGEAASNRPVAFLFSGQGSQYINMAAGLYADEPVFRGQVDDCADLLRSELGLDLRDLLFPAEREAEFGGSRPAAHNGHRPGDDGLLHQTQYTQPALFVIEYALARLWMSWGVQPEALLGHSVGEYVAACLAGVFSLEDALKLVAARGRLMQQLQPGAMLSVALGEQEVRALLGADLALAAVNGPSLCVVAGPKAAIEALEQQLTARNVTCRRLQTSHAFHSAMMDPILEAFTRIVGQIELNEPHIPFVSNVTGTWIAPEEATNPAYWARHLRQTVRFADGLGTLMAEPARALLEVGPGQSLCTFARRHPDQRPDRVILSSLRSAQDEQADQAFLLTTLGRLWLAGVNVDWEAFSDGELRQRVALPTYPFERRRYWVDAQSPSLRPRAEWADLRMRPDIADWLYTPSWTRDNLARGAQDVPARTLVFADESGLGEQIARRLTHLGGEVVKVRVGTSFAQAGADAYICNPRRRSDYDAMLNSLHAQGKAPDAIIHLWSLAEAESVEAAQAIGGMSLLLLTQALGQHGTTPMRLSVVSSGIHDVTGDEALRPEQATLLGVCRVIPQEYPHVSCQCIDIPMPAGESQVERLAERVVAELASPGSASMVAYRGNHRWTQTFAPLRLAEPSPTPELRQHGVYLITGGLGRIGLALADELARSVQAKLVLVGRSALPAHAIWTHWLATHSEQDETSCRIERIQALEALGAEVLVVAADVADPEQIRSAVLQAEARFGALHGVFHAAGLVGGETLRAIQEIDAVDYEAHLRPKVYGTIALEAALRGRTLDFVLLQSSLSAILGGLGMAAYAAGNAFMDVFAQGQRQAGVTPWISVNWDAWRFETDQAQLAAISSDLPGLALAPEAGMDVFRRVLSLPGAAQVVISTGDLDIRINRYTHRTAHDPFQVTQNSTLYARPLDESSYSAPRSALEREIADLWQHILGIEQIGVHDNFFELGGHSLLATQLVSRLRDTYGVELPLRKLFETPTVAALAAMIETPDTAATQPLSTIQPIPREGDLTLSFGQRRLWFLDQLEPGSPLYNNTAAVRLTGILDVALLERSLNEIVRRHEVLRTAFVTVDGRPVQVVTPADAAAMTIEMVDLRDSPRGEQELIFLRLAAVESQRAFDLTSGPLLRVILAQFGDEEQIVLLTLHHIVSDGWSVGVLVREFAALYDAFAQDQSSPLPELAIQYSDFAHWQQQWLRGEILEQQLAYWRAHLGGDLPILDLPTDRPRPALQTYNGASHWFMLPQGLSERLNSLSQQSGVTLFMTLLAAFQTLLHRYSGQDDLCVGTPIAGRTRAETEALIGFFVNVLVLRADLSGNPTFRELLGRVREVTLGAYAHQDLPFEMLVDELRPQRDLSRSPLFQVIFVLQNAPMQPLNLPGLSLEPLDLNRSTEKYDLTLVVEEQSNGLKCLLNYNTDLFDAPTIERMAGHLHTLLEGIVADPDQRLAALPILTLSERYQLLIEWNDTATADPPAPCIHRQFEAQVERTPNALALICDEERLTYQELNARANQLAHRLRSLGVGPETLVGVGVDRSVESIVSLLAILKAGGAYLPLDPAYPADRLAFMLEDSRAAVLLTATTDERRPTNDGLLEDRGSKIEDRHVSAAETRSSILDPLSPVVGGQWSVVDLFGDRDAIQREPDTNLDDSASAEHAAYVIYTSGSTGKPKGVVVTHESIANHSRDVVKHYQLDARDRVLQFASLNFDASLEQILPPLTVGAAVVLRGTEVWDPADFHLKVHEYGLTVINPPTAYWHQLVQQWASTPTSIPQGLRLAIAGGDMVRPESVRLWMQAGLRSVRLLNAYGPTETTITAVTFDVPADERANPRRIPIGRPLDNRRVYILDSYGNPVPVGVPGELYIGGAGLARGYLNRPELTDAKFVPDPFAKAKGKRQKANAERLYKTGDLVCYRADGAIEFLGRVDQQVKIRGFRVEPGEIEAALGQHPAVREAIVLAREDAPGDKRLVAYVVPTADHRPPTNDEGEAHTGELVVGRPSSLVGELRAFLKAQLPEYMLPSAFVVLDEWPMTPSGKVDRRALPAPDGSGRASSDTFVAPNNPIEQQLAEIWSELLGATQVGIHDDFFELGGHSLLATQLVSRLRDTFQVELPLRQLFEMPTVAGVAQLIINSQFEQADSDDISDLLSELDQLSEDEIQRMLADELS